MTNIPDDIDVSLLSAHFTSKRNTAAVRQKSKFLGAPDNRGTAFLSAVMSQAYE